MQIVQRQQKQKSLLAHIKEGLSHNRARFSPEPDQANLGAVVAGNESFGESAASMMGTFITQMTDSLESEIIKGFNTDREEGQQVEISDAGYKAASVILAAAGSSDGLESYHQKVSNVQAMAGTDVVQPDLLGAHGSLNYTDKGLGLEAFDDSPLKDWLAETVDFNMQAVRQSPFSEMFYRTVVLAPTQPGLDITVARPVVIPDLRRDYTTDYGEWGMRNLLDAVIDHTILDSKAIDAVPIHMATPEDTTGYFVDAGTITPRDVSIEGATYKTSALLPGEKIPLLQLSTNPGLRKAGEPDFTDALNPNIALETLYLEIQDGTNTSIVPVEVKGLPFSQWLKSPEGKDRDMVLNFNNMDIPLTGTTKDITGADAAALGGLTGANSDVLVRLHTKAMGSANLQFGDIHLVSCTSEIHGVYRKTGEGNFQEEVAPATAATIISSITSIKVIGYDVHATRSLLNKHTRGDIVDTIAVQEKFPIMMGQPITSLKPLSSPTTGDSDAIDSLIAASRVRTDNNALTKALNYADTLEAIQPNSNRDTRVPDIEGVGRWFVRPYFERRQVDLLNVVNSVKTHERAADVSAALVNEIRRWTYSALKHSGFAAACEYMPGGKIKVLIGLDREMQNHIQITGDTRLVGMNVEYDMQASDDQRIYDKILLSLSREDSGEAIDVLSNGVHAWVPPVVGSANIDRQGRSSRELTVQLRNRHINNVPIMGIIEVSNLKPAVTEYINYRTIDETPTPTP